MSGLFGGVLPAGRGIRGGMDFSCEGINFGSKSSVREGSGLS